MQVSLKSVAAAALIGLGLSSAAFAAPATIQPNETASKDTFIYSAIPTGLPFGNATYLGASIETSGVHTVHSLIQFDLTGVSLAAGETAKLNIGTRSKAATPFANVASDPSPTAPVTVDVYAITSAWDEGTTTFSTQPTIAPVPLASFVVTSTSMVYSVDVTAAVAAWLAAPATNNGFELRQRSIATVPGAPDAAAVFHSAGGAVPPSLTIAVPEPTTLASLAGLSMLVGRRRR